MNDLLSIPQASEFATQFLKKLVTTSNISYLIQYGRVKKFGHNGSTQIRKHDLIDYYKSNLPARESAWKKRLGDDLNWALSFDQYKEYETTKHVHRLHPYKGKFIPQLVEYFLDGHTDAFKKSVFFQKGDIVLDPFCGSGTTLVQANELGMHAVGVDVSTFNGLISNLKISRHDLIEIQTISRELTQKLEQFLKDSRALDFEAELLVRLKDFNLKHFPSPSFKYKIRNGEINEHQYGREKEKDFLKTYNALIKKYGIQLHQKEGKSFLDKWYLQMVRDEIDFMFEQIKKIKNVDVKKVITIILSRTIRSCRATTHSDLATLKEPQTTTYYCRKHGKICKPLFSILSWWKRYSVDTTQRLKQFENLRTNTEQLCLTGDSRIVNIFSELAKRKPNLVQLAKKQKIKGIFSSPPYVGLINYHEQHAYAYDLFGFGRNDESEIGPLFRGQGLAAQESYVEGVAAVLNNCKKYLAEDYSVFLVANDKWNLYSRIAEKAGMRIVERFKRPVLNRTERDKGAYCEEIFLMKEKI
ncbi:site-specific DNA-methyltransferase [Candidatus Gracilibacteria bacterium]|nr:site-specific DNA-methyltransferase [Candidatus Gracilibacteria bacterium]MCF7856653.1 site-specific DNA-methyltransferase [Candidatus Gracilibacteria bacterium]MCF7896970.1 site-specific DNA-methyltransferase [Candidatus Gracilibacteria bacterium]